MLRLTARYADGWNGFYSRFNNQPEGLVPQLAALDAACAAVGRDPATLARTVAVYLQSGPFVPTADWGVKPLSGTPEDLAEALRAYAAYGVTHIQLGLEPQTRAGIAACAPILEALDRA
jgi:alkanesulfonate monooxygenase SsuD/methylene tetrahydromethanopterin reductase-like flavin-dependent oxidoreductase (luciferase family)